MKNKVLLSTLLGSALLVGCTTDDALDVRKNVAEGVNPAAPVFTVSFGDELTRASMETDGVHAMTWDAVDKMSLFHGGGANHQKFASNNFLASGPVANLNAIYSMSGGEGETPEFTTASMVTEGLAIMVYPADTTFAQQGVNPIINLTMDQNSETKNLTPHISEVLDIHTYDPNDAHSAGYGRKYDLVMRQIGSQLRLTLDGEKPGVEGIEFRRVTMTVGDLAHSPFTKNLEVKVGQKRRNVIDGTLEEGDEGQKQVGANIDGHEYWMYSPWMEPAETTVDATGEQVKKNGRSKYIATTDIKEGKTAIFTLLPYEDRKDDGNGTYNAPFKDGYNGEIQYGDVTIKVETNFGWVEVKDEGDTKLWRNKAGVQETIKGGLASVLQALFKAEEKGNKLYSGQLKGKGAERFLKVDLSDLKMHGLHVRDEIDLMKVLDVYHVLKEGKSDEKVTFILDGNDEGKFRMTKNTWVALETRLAEEGNKVSFALCNDEAPCTAIVLDNTGATSAAEVPALQFVKLDEEGKIIENASAEARVELVGSWIYSSVTENPNTAAEDMSKNMNGVGTLVVKGSIELQKYISAISENSANFKIVVEKGANVNVSGIVNLQVNMDNHGRITIPAGGDQRLSVNSGAVLTNCEEQGEKATGWWKVNTVNNVDVEEAGGVIDNYNMLSIVNGSNGKIYNYGTINVWNNDATTLITANSDETATMNTLFTNTEQANAGKNGGNTNRIGTINLLKEDAGVNNLTIQRSTDTNFSSKTETIKRGFVKMKNSTNTKKNGVFNYVVIDGETASYVVKSDNDYKNVRYIEIESSKRVVLNCNDVKLNGLIVPAEKSIWINNGEKVELDSTEGRAYVKGTISFAGTFTWTSGQLQGYFGGDEANDKENLYSFQ